MKTFEPVEVLGARISLYDNTRWGEPRSAPKVGYGRGERSFLGFIGEREELSGLVMKFVQEGQRNPVVDQPKHTPVSTSSIQLLQVYALGIYHRKGVEIWNSMVEVLVRVRGGQGWASPWAKQRRIGVVLRLRHDVFVAL